MYDEEISHPDWMADSACENRHRPDNRTDVSNVFVVFIQTILVQYSAL